MFLLKRCEVSRFTAYIYVIMNPSNKVYNFIADEIDEIAKIYGKRRIKCNFYINFIVNIVAITNEFRR